MNTYLRIIIKTNLLSQKEKRELITNLFIHKNELQARNFLSTPNSLAHGFVIKNIIDGAMLWRNTPQGQTYWEDIADRVGREELITEEAENL